MRASNYSNTREAYTSWSHTDMVRAALVEGIVVSAYNRASKGDAGKAENEAQRHRRLLKEYAQEGLHGRIDHAFDILRQTNLTGPQKGYVAALLIDFGKPESWKRMDHAHLEREGVIVRYNGGLSGLVDLMYHTPEYKVVVVDKFPIDEETDYLKHVPNQHKLLLNGVQVVRDFAQQEGIQLPDNYLRSGRIGAEVRALLAAHEFTFNKAFEHAVSVMQKHPERFTAVFVIKNSDGNEMRFTPYALVAGDELYEEIDALQKPGRSISMRHGEVSPEFKYHGCNLFNIPKRKPFGAPGGESDAARSQTHNEVQIFYMPHVARPREMVLEWMDTRASCNCDSALNLRNFEERRRNTVRAAGYFDAHCRVALRYVADNASGTLGEYGYNLMLFPTAGFLTLVDRFRYNLSNGSGSVGTPNICFLVNEALKIDAPFSRKFRTEKPLTEDVLKPGFLVKQRNKLRE